MCNLLSRKYMSHGDALFLSTYY